MFPYIPIYYLFIAFMFQRLEEKNSIKASVLIATLVLCWIVNLHHIWGLLHLPSREISLAFAIIGGFIMLLIYLKLRSERKTLLVHK